MPTKNNIKLKIIISVMSILTALLLTLGVIGVINNRKVNASNVLDIDLKERYVVGTQIVVPNYAMVISEDKIYYSNEGYLIYPNGDTISTGKEFVLDAVGQYTVRCYFDKDSKSDYAEKTFDVIASENANVDCTLTINVSYAPSAGDRVFSTLNYNFQLFDVKVEGAAFSHLTKEVYYNYKTDKQVNVFVENNAFVTKYVGEYTIVYKAFDIYGNSVTKEVPVYCINTEDNQMISFDIEGGLAGVNAIVGSTVQLPSGSALKINGVNKLPSVKVKALFESEKYEVEVNENMQFVPTFVGTWKIVYTLTDNITSIEKSFDLNVQTTTDLVYLGDLRFENIYIKNAEYTLDTYEAYTFNGATRTKVNVDIATRYAGAGEYQKTASNVVKIEGDTSVSFQYSYNGQILLTTPDYEVKDVGFKGAWNAVNYFTGEGVDVVTSGNTMNFVTSETGDKTFSFIKEISFSNFAFNFNVVKDKVNYDGIRVTLTDYYDSSNKLDAIVTFGTEKTQLTVKGINSAYSKNSKDPATKLILNYESEMSSICLGDARIAVDNPFATDKCLLSVTMLNVSGESGLTVSKINNQMIGKIASDTGAPQIVVDREDSVKMIDDIIKIFVPVATDVLSPIRKSDVKVSVIAPDESYVKTVDGVELNEVLADKIYEVQLTQYGKYTVTYSVKDQSSKTAKLAMNYLVIDVEAPTIEFVGSVKTGEVINVEKGVEHFFEETVCTDNLGEVSATAFIISPSDKLQWIKAPSFVPDEVGIYKIYLRVEDSSFNSNSVYYYINVTEPIVEE